LYSFGGEITEIEEVALSFVRGAINGTYIYVHRNETLNVMKYYIILFIFKTFITITQHTLKLQMGALKETF